MQRFKLTIEYDGSPYKGWQVNKGEVTVQGKMIEVCEKVFSKPVKEFYGSGRTDSGVHAIGQVAHFDVDTVLKPYQIRMKFNDELPHSINVLNVEAVQPRFHARFDATARSYVYLISKRRTAFFKRNVWWIKDSLNIDKMHKAAENFVGLKDFQSFGRSTGKDESTKVEIIHADIYEQQNTIMVHIIGSHFLWNQIRRMVGTLVEVGRGNLKNEDVASFMAVHSEIPAKYTAPPAGLYLERVYYGNEKLSNEPVWPVVIQ